VDTLSLDTARLRHDRLVEIASLMTGRAIPRLTSKGFKSCKGLMLRANVNATRARITTREICDEMMKRRFLGAGCCINDEAWRYRA
jgi:hypothetical protein